MTTPADENEKAARKRLVEARHALQVLGAETWENESEALERARQTALVFAANEFVRAAVLYLEAVESLSSVDKPAVAGAG